MDNELKHLHLLGASGKSRTVVEGDVEWLVVPVVALMEGVIHPVNAASPEFVSAAVLEAAAASWNGKPITLGHPVDAAGKQCSAADEKILAASGVGEIRNSRYENRKILQEAWIDKKKAKKHNAKMLAALEADEMTEVSVGAFVRTLKEPGDFGARTFREKWAAASGDHLALLPGGRGACSCDMGCGTHRAAMHFIAAEGIETIPEDLYAPGVTVCSMLDGKSLNDRIEAVHTAVAEKWRRTDGGGNVTGGPYSYAYAYAQQIFDDVVIVKVDDKLMAVPYDAAADGSVTLREGAEVWQTYVAASRYAECETCGGTGQVKNGDSQQDCPTCEGNGKLKAAAGARHSANDNKMIQAVHDHAVSLGAACAQPENTRPIEFRINGKKVEGITPLPSTEEVDALVFTLDTKQLAAAITPPEHKPCGCHQPKGVSAMTKEQKAAEIAALTSDKHSGYTDADVALLEGTSDEQLARFKANAAANKAKAEKAEKDGNDLVHATAKIGVLEGKVTALEAQPTDEQWLERAPAGIKTLLADQKRAEEEVREGLIKALKGVGTETEEQLKAMSTADLKTRAAYARVQAPDHSGRALPQMRAAEGGTVAKPSNGWAKALETQAAK